MINRLKLQLHKAQNRMRQLADSHKSEREFDVGGWVWLKLHPYRQQSSEVEPQIFWPFPSCVEGGKSGL